MHTAPALALTLVVVAGLAPTAAAVASGEAVSLRTVEGSVTEVHTSGEKGEGDLELLTLRLQIGEAESAESLLVLLAPSDICEEIGFEVAEGDRLRARVFVEDEGPARAQKALNLTRGRMARFRTLRDMPLWTSSGAWQGGPSRAAPGAMAGHRHRGGGGR